MPHWLKFFKFIPLALGFVMLSVLVNDLRHPTTRQDQCIFVGRGSMLSQFRDHATVLYKRGIREEEDLGFHCQQLDNILINDDLLDTVKANQPIELVIKEYQLIPTRYHFRVPVVTSS